ncbi:DNA-3-methyladenine glycosylase I [Oleidesulfovibrio alaskensis G20]|jgi:DNA-3-methyladenine glycosylase I|uniref:DNA-3-methyladenine glycosylase I n=2 Tax=Oleidesulfovibrio alaskensis TaxID=58180 RepID=Q30V02_OLEA2|nr:DNA-3-methyladenine glycosylase I [Oleidesulfovibrio alaskensis]ABB40494.1 DNA-3-methyladenine glycosylase I [Oleidesulfovibrio alaskensis G20]
MNAPAHDTRCPWARTPEETAYHDHEWGVPVRDDRRHFEFLVLEGAQAGLSWLTVLRRREGYRSAFAGFDPAAVAAFDESRMAALQQDTRIIRNRLKIASAVRNARAFLRVQEEFGSYDSYIWRFTGGRPVQNQWRSIEEVPAATPLSDRISRDMKQRGFNFVGSTIVYALMQATGMVNDHLVTCPRHAPVRALGEGM